MILVDTSVWIEVLKDKSGALVEEFNIYTRQKNVVFCRYIQLELLQGAKDEFEWKKLDEYLATQYYLETSEDTWREASRIYFDLRRSGITVRSSIDCCIAQIAVENGVTLLHRDNDFLRIGDFTKLSQQYFTIN